MYVLKASHFSWSFGLSLELPLKDDVSRIEWVGEGGGVQKLIWCCNFFIIFSKIRKEIIGVFFFLPISRLFFIKFYIICLQHSSHWLDCTTCSLLNLHYNQWTHASHSYHQAWIFLGRTLACLPMRHASHNWLGWLMWGIPFTIFLSPKV